MVSWSVGKVFSLHTPLVKGNIIFQSSLVLTGTLCEPCLKILNEVTLQLFLIIRQWFVITGSCNVRIVRIMMALLISNIAGQAKFLNLF